MSDGDLVRSGDGEPRSSPFRVGDWLVEPAWNRISRSGQFVRLEPRVMRLLLTLGTTPGHPQSRQDLLRTVWPDLFVNEEALSRAVSQLRRAFGDDPKAPLYIKTVHKTGYSLVAPVTDVPAEAAFQPAPTTKRAKHHLLWSSLLILSISLAAAMLYRGARLGSRPQAFRALVPLTSEPGREIDPVVSPDGRWVVYLATSGAGYELFVRGIEGGAPRRLTDNSLVEGHPTWSPTGDRIAFVAAQGDAAAIHILEMRSRSATKLIDLPSWSFGLDWSADGRTLAYVETVPGEPAGIVLLDIASKAARPLDRSDSSAGDFKPVFSPDGKRLAVIRNDVLDRQRIAVFDLQHGGQAVVLGTFPQQLRGLDWVPGGQALVYSARLGRKFGLWRLVADRGAAPEGLATEGGDLFNPSVSIDGHVVVEEVEQDSDIWSADLAGDAAAPLIRSTADDYGPAYAPGSTRLAFVSERSGAPEIWIKSRGAETRLTKLASPDISRIAISADGAQLAFLAEEDGVSSIYAGQIGGGKQVRLLRNRRGFVPLGWSAGAQSLFVLAPADRYWHLQEIDLTDRRIRAIAAPNLRLAAVSATGASIFMVPANEDKLLRLVPGQGIVQQFRFPPSFNRLVALLPAADAVYLVEDAFGTALVHRLDLRSGAIGPTIRISGYRGDALSLAPDGNSIAYAHARETANDLAVTTLSSP